MNSPMESVPFVVHEAAMARQERTIKRLWILCIIVIFLFVGTNIAWIIYENSFTDEMVTVTQENSDGYNNYIGENGDITN